MISMLILFLTLTIPSLYFYLKYDKRIEELIPITIFVYILILYLMGLFNILKIGFYINIVIVIIFLVLMLYQTRKKLFKIKKIFTPAFIFWILLFVFSYYFYKDRMLIEWDEFTHWGDVVKMMFNENILSTNINSMSVAKSYPPILSLFQYFVQLINGTYNEGFLFIAYQIFAFSLFMPFIKNITWRELDKLLIVLVIMLLSPLVIFVNFYQSIYVDAILGMMFAFSIANIYIVKNYDKFNLLKISISLFILTLLKDVGVLFSLICWGLIVYDLFINEKNYKILKKINKYNIKCFFKKMLPSIIFISVILFAYISWKINVIINIEISSSSVVSYTSIIKALLNQETSYLNNVILNYIGTFSNIQMINKYNIIEFSSIMLFFLMFS